MRMVKRALVAAATLACATATALPAMAASSAALPTLSLSALGGPPVAVGDILNSSLTPGSSLSLTTAPSGGVGLFCAQSSWQATTLANPANPGPATVRITAMTIASCKDTVPGVTGVVGVVATNLPVLAQVSGAAPFPTQIIPGGGPGPLGITATLTTAAGTVTCVYQSLPPLQGSTGLGSVPWTFLNQRFQLLSGPLPFCGAPLNYYTASFSPVIDITAAGATVFVN